MQLKAIPKPHKKGFLTKTLLVMKLTTILLLAACIQVHATAFSQTVTFSGRNVTLETVFSNINKQTGYIVFCDYALIRDAKKVTIHAKDASVESIMNAALKDQPLSYEIVNKTIVISKKLIVAGALTASVAEMPPPVDIKGRVTNEKGEAVPAATVAVKGSNKITATNDNGEFELKGISNNAVLIITSVGFEKQEIKLNGQTSLNVQLKLQAALNEVVVTALGIQRKAKSLTYSTEEVKGAALTAVPETNIMNAMQGKVSGLNVFRGSGGAGGSVNVVIRGSKSFNNNQPLYVIDGIPFQNNSPTQPAGIYNGAALPDAGDNLSQINSEDIESVTVLKGASASALYGSQGQNGVILITTKKGHAGGITVDYAVGYNRDTRAYGPKLQYTYPETTPGANYSWGTTKGSYKNIEGDFFVPGNTWTHSVSLRGGDANRNSYLSYSNTNASNIYPNSNYNKNTFDIRQSNTYLGGKLTADANVLFTEQHYKNPPSPGLYNNPITGLYLFPRGLDFQQYKDHFEVFNTPKNYSLQNWWNIDWIAQPSGGGGDDNQQNPFWILNRDVFTQKTDKAYGSLALKYTFSDYLNLQLRGNIDKEWRTLESKLSSGTQTVLADPLGKYKLFKYDNQQIYGDAILNFSKKYGDLNVGALAGASIQSIDNYSQHFEGPLVLANVFNLANIRYANLTVEEHEYRKKKEGVFGGLNLAWRDMLFLDVTARNDWSSALAYPVGGLGLPTKSYFYPSVGLSAIMNDVIKLPDFIQLWKLRASYAVVGNDIDPYQTYAYSYFTYNQNGVAAGSNGPYPGTVLQPERTHSVELGTEFRLRNDLLFFDFTWFKINTKDQLVTFQAPVGQTFNNYLINAGNIQNSGFELSVGSTPVKTHNFKWDIYATLYVNTNIVKEFNGTDNNVHAIAGADNGNMTYFGIKKGLPYPTFFGKKFVRDPKDGMILIDTGANLGKPLYTLYSADTTGLGTSIPKAILGFRNTFTYGRLSFSFFIDGRIGGQVMDVTQAILDEYGVSQASADARDHASTFLPVKGKYVGGGTVTSIDPKTWYGAVGSRAGLAEYYMTSGTNVRLREMSLSYSLKPEVTMAKTHNVIKALSFGLNARNLFFFYKKANFDPDIAVGTSNGNQGYNAFTAPATRSIGGSIKVSF
jgi:TonB-linked SusC/RagA family outer membrane protein